MKKLMMAFGADTIDFAADAMSIAEGARGEKPGRASTRAHDPLRREI